MYQQFDNTFKDRTNKKPIATVHYTNNGKGKYRCRYCKHFSGGKCNAVIGNISPEGVCSLYEEGGANSARSQPSVKPPEEINNQPTNKLSPALKRGIHSDPSIAQTPV